MTADIRSETKGPNAQLIRQLATTRLKNRNWLRNSSILRGDDVAKSTLYIDAQKRNGPMMSRVCFHQFDAALPRAMLPPTDRPGRSNHPRHRRRLRDRVSADHLGSDTRAPLPSSASSRLQVTTDGIKPHPARQVPEFDASRYCRSDPGPGSTRSLYHQNVVNTERLSFSVTTFWTDVFI